MLLGARCLGIGMGSLDGWNGRSPSSRTFSRLLNPSHINIITALLQSTIILSRSPYLRFIFVTGYTNYRYPQAGPYGLERIIIMSLQGVDHAFQKKFSTLME
ncbi:unnamed protein product [Rhodiola kirilowii]